MKKDFKDLPFFSEFEDFFDNYKLKVVYTYLRSSLVFRRQKYIDENRKNKDAKHLDIVIRYDGLIEHIDKMMNHNYIPLIDEREENEDL